MTDSADIVERLNDKHFLSDAAKARMPEEASEVLFLMRRERSEAAATITALRQQVEEIGRRDHAALYERAIDAVRALDDYTNTNETEFTGWGDGAVPPRATFWRVKSGQALKALSELADMADTCALHDELTQETTDGR